MKTVHTSNHGVNLTALLAARPPNRVQSSHLFESSLKGIKLLSLRHGQGGEQELKAECWAESAGSLLNVTWNMVNFP